jgi:hypothetical protein
MTALSAIFGLAAFVASIIILIDAFKASVGQGFLCLCIPFYILYYAFARFQHDKKNLIVGVLIVGWVLAIALSLAGGMSSFSSLSSP